MSRSTICIGDKFTFINYGVLTLKRMDIDKDEFVFDGRAVHEVTFRREDLVEKTFDTQNHVGDRVAEANHGTGRIIGIKDEATHWPYHILFDSGHSAWYGADGFEVTSSVWEQKGKALAVAEREISFHTAKLSEWQAIRDSLLE